MEANFLDGAGKQRHKSAAERAAFSARAFAEADQAALDWAKRVAAAPVTSKLPHSYQKIWGKLMKEAGYNFGLRSDFVSSPGG